MNISNTYVRTNKGVKHISQKATSFADNPPRQSPYQLQGIHSQVSTWCAQVDPSKPSPDIRGKGGLIQTSQVAPSEHSDLMTVEE